MHRSCKNLNTKIYWPNNFQGWSCDQGHFYWPIKVSVVFMPALQIIWFIYTLQWRLLRASHPIKRSVSCVCVVRFRAFKSSRKNIWIRRLRVRVFLSFIENNGGQSNCLSQYSKELQSKICLYVLLKITKLDGDPVSLIFLVLILDSRSYFFFLDNPSRGRSCNEVIPTWSSKPEQQDQAASPGTTFPSLYERCAGLVARNFAVLYWK